MTAERRVQMLGPRGPKGAPAALARTFSEAVDHHKAGRLDQAEQGYRRILEAQPRNPDALNMLGVAAAQRGRLDDARKTIRRAIRVDGDNPVYHYNLGMVQQAAGDHAGAEKSYRRALDLKRDYVDALKGLGGVYLFLERLDEAERCCRKALQLAPEDPFANNNLAAVLLALERFDEAEARARKAIELVPRYAEAHNNLAAAHLGREEFEAALTCLEEALRLKPDYPDALNNLGLANAGLGRPMRAMDAFHRAIRIRPTYAEAHNGLANTYRKLGYWSDAIHEYQEALRLKPDYAAAKDGYGLVLIDKGDLEASLARYEEMLARNPNDATALSGKVSVLERKGDVETGYALIKPIIDTGDPPPPIAIALGAIARKVGESDRAVALLERALDNAELRTDQRKLIHFYLGRLYDADGDYDAAFTHYAAGNALEATSYDPEDHTRRIDRIIEHYGAERFPKLARSRVDSELPVFVVGTPRSGTSLTEQILASHAAVVGGGELEEVARSIRECCGGPRGDVDFLEVITALDSDRLTAIAEEYLAKLPEHGPEVLRVTDKMPYNYLHLGYIAQLFPNARVVHCRRDPLDSCLSCFFQNFTRGNMQTYDLEHLGLYYREYERLMRHWHAVLDLPILDLPYEELVADLEGWSRRLIDFVGLDWDPECLRFHESTRFVNTASYDQVRRPVYTRSVGRWRHYEAHLEPLKKALGIAA